MSEKIPCVYILANKRNGTLYTGVTSNLKARVLQHKSGEIPGFTQKYKIQTLVYFEQGESMEVAIMREKQIKGGSRKNKLALIEGKNPIWKDLFDEL